MRRDKTIHQILSLSFVLVSLSSCGLWPYKSDFDCPIPEGEQCQSLYETNLKADAGAYAPTFMSSPPMSNSASSATLHSSQRKACCSACASHNTCKVSV